MLQAAAQPAASAESQTTTLPAPLGDSASPAALLVPVLPKTRPAHLTIAHDAPFAEQPANFSVQCFACPPWLGSAGHFSACIAPGGGQTRGVLG